MTNIKEKIRNLRAEGYDIDNLCPADVAELISEDAWDVLGVMFCAGISGAGI